MESSLALLFMEANLPGLPLSWETAGEGAEELQEQVMKTSMELQSAREAAELQCKLDEAKICRLQGLLDVAMKERDEARVHCGKLRECILHLAHSTPQAPPAPMNYATEVPCSLLQSSLSCTSSPAAQCSHHSPSSPTIDTISFQDSKQKVGANEDVLISEDDVTVKCLPDVEDIFTLDLNPDPSLVTSEDSQQQFSMDILNDDVCLDEDEGMDLHPCAGSARHQNATPNMECVTNIPPDDALPEKGKLLWAVMQAGPLLQNLLLVGPLPQWRYPPPQLSTVDISTAFTAPCSMPLHNYPPPSISGLVPNTQSSLMRPRMSIGHANSAQFAYQRGKLGVTSPSMLCIKAGKSDRNLYVGRAQKLRKLSPIGVK